MNRRAKDLFLLSIGLGVVPLAWFVWTLPSSYLLDWLRTTSILWVPFGLLLLGFWLYDNVVSGFPTARWRARLARSSGFKGKIAVPAAVGAIFLSLFALVALNALLTGSGREEAQSNTFMLGLVTFIAGLAITFSGFGEKEDPARTAHIITSRSGSRLFPRAKALAKPTEEERHDRKPRAALADLLGLSIIVASVLLMLTSAFL